MDVVKWCWLSDVGWCWVLDGVGCRVLGVGCWVVCGCVRNLDGGVWCCLMVLCVAY